MRRPGGRWRRRRAGSSSGSRRCWGWRRSTKRRRRSPARCRSTASKESVLKITELVSSTRTASRCPPAAPLGDVEITGLTADSRQVQRGFLFAALPGTRSDGRKFAGEAAARGAAAILTDDAALLSLDPAARASLAIVTDPNPHRALALCAARFYRRQPAVIAAVTGTNGKTSVAHFTRELWAALGDRSASLGTLGWVVGDE